jgi:hypothetical protein
MKPFFAKILLILSLLVVISLSVSAQANCPLIPTTNILLNLQLGMSAVEVNQKLGPGFQIKIKNDKDYRFFQNYIDRQPPGNLSGVRAFYLRFFEKKLYQIEIFYEEDKFPSDLKSFTETISNQMNLPVSDWKITHLQAVLTCGENSLKIDYQINPRIELTDETVLKKVTEKYKSDKKD